MRRYVWLLVAACGSTPDVPPTAMPPPLEDSTQSGTRLHIHWVAGDGERARDATPVPYFYDSQLGVDCTPAQWDDGLTYCTPVTVDREFLLVNRDLYGDIVYADSTCSQPIATTSPLSTCKPDYAALDDGPGYLPRFARALYKVGGAASITQYWDGGPGACVGPRNIASNYRYSLTTGAIDRTTLVPLSYSEPRGSGRLRWHYVESPDGLSYPDTLFDSKLYTNCSMRPTSTPGELVCYPTSYVMVDVTQYARVQLTGAGDARLAPAVYTSSDTAVYAGGLYDRDAGAPCNWRPVADGTARCLGDAAPMLTLYREQGCITPIDVVVVGAGTTPAPVFYKVAPGCEGTIAAVYDAGAPYSFTPWEQQVTCLPYTRSQGEMPLSLTFYGPGAPLGFDALGPLVTRSMD